MSILWCAGMSNVSDRTGRGLVEAITQRFSEDVIRCSGEQACPTSLRIAPSTNMPAASGTSSPVVPLPSNAAPLICVSIRLHTSADAMPAASGTSSLAVLLPS